MNIIEPLSFSLLFWTQCAASQHPYEDGTQEIKELSRCHHSKNVTPVVAHRNVLWTLMMNPLVSPGTKICSVQHDLWSDPSQSWLSSIQLPSHNISRELQLPWSKSGMTWRHLWIMESGEVWFESQHRWFIQRTTETRKGGCFWSLLILWQGLSINCV